MSYKVNAPIRCWFCKQPINILDVNHAARCINLTAYIKTKE